MIARFFSRPFFRLVGNDSLVITDVFILLSISLFEGLHVPEAVIQVVAVLHADAPVVPGDFSRGHRGHAYTQRGLLPLRHHSNNCTFLHGAHLGLLVREARAHDVGPAEDELDGALVHAHPRQHEGVLVQQLEGWHPLALPLPEEQQFPVTPGDYIDVVMAFNNFEWIFLG